MREFPQLISVRHNPQQVRFLGVTNRPETPPKNLGSSAFEKMHLQDITFQMICA